MYRQCENKKIKCFRVCIICHYIILTLCKLSEKLIVKVVAVGQHNDSRAVKCLLQAVNVKDHRESVKAVGTDAWNEVAADRQYKIRFALREGGFVNRITVHYLN